VAKQGKSVKDVQFSQAKEKFVTPVVFTSTLQPYGGYSTGWSTN